MTRIVRLAAPRHRAWRWSPSRHCWPRSIASMPAPSKSPAWPRNSPPRWAMCRSSSAICSEPHAWQPRMHPVVKLLQTVFEEALRTRASDIHIEPQEKSLRIRFRIDGVLHVQTEADHKIAGHVAAPEADVRARHLGKAPAAGRPLQHQGAQQPGRRAYLDHADAVWRIGGDAPAQPEHRPARAGPASACRQRILDRMRHAIRRPFRHGAGDRSDR
jgi:hypothetical protein